MHRKISFLMTLFLLILGVALPASAFTHQPAPLAATTTFNLPLSVLTQYGGGVRRVAIDGNRAFVVIGPRVAVVDITNPAAPTVLGVTPLLSYSVSAIKFTGNYLHVVLGVQGYRIYDVTDPSNITLAGSFSGTYYAVEVDGNYTYLGSGSTLRVLNISNPASITSVANVNSIISGNIDFLRMFTQGANSYLAVPGSVNGLYILDVTNPASPSNIGNVDTPGLAFGVQVEGNYAYIADFVGIQIANISNPSAPTLTGGLTGLSNVNSLAVDVSGPDILIYATSSLGLKVYDANDFSAITEIGTYSSGAPSGFNPQVVYANSVAYLAASEQGLHIVDVSTPDTPTDLSILGPVDRMVGGAMLNDTTLIVANSTAGFKVMDVSDPSNPTFITSVTTSGNVRLVKTVDAYAVVHDGQFLRMYDMTNPASPIETDAVASSFTGHSMTVTGTLAVIGLQVNVFRVFDISDPNNITDLGVTVMGSGTTTTVRLVGNRLYAITTSGGLYIYDLSTPSSPALLGSYLSTEITLDFAVIGNYVIVTPDNTGLIIDVSDPTQPTLAQSFNKTAWAASCSTMRNIEMRGPIAVVNCSSSVILVDLSDPFAPQFISQQALLEPNSVGLTLNGNQIYVFQALNGYQALGFQLYQVMLPILQK